MAPIDLTQFLVIGISSRALFNLDAEHRVFEEEGSEKFDLYQIAHEKDILEPGTGFPLVQAILNLNQFLPDDRKVQVVVMSRNNVNASLRVYNSVRHYGLDITRGAFTCGTPVTTYLRAFDVDLFLSASEDDVRQALSVKVASGLIYARPQSLNAPIDQLRIAFDGDAVIFSDEAEKIYKKNGLEAFVRYEQRNARRPLPEGPFAKLLRSLSYLQHELQGGSFPIRLALVTARDSQASERVIRTLRAWKINMDEAFFMGGARKDRVLEAFRPHIFFDDQHVHCEGAAQVAPTARVSYLAEESTRSQGASPDSETKNPKGTESLATVTN